MLMELWIFGMFCAFAYMYIHSLHEKVDKKSGFLFVVLWPLFILMLLQTNKD
jgi:hypothetical protein